jgi:hypothetical protein
VASKSTLLGREAILAVPDRAFDDVEVPEWGGLVRVAGMSGAERDAFEQSCYRQRNGQQVWDGRRFRAKLAARTIVDENGLRIFSEDDVAELARKSAKALQRVFEAAARLSGMSKDDLESLEGNSDAQDDASPSA